VTERSWTRRLRGVAAAAAAAVVLAVGCGGRSGGAEGKAAEEALPPVRVTEVTRATVTERVCVTGSLESPAEVTIFPEVSGRLVEVRVEEGSVVKAGDVLAVIEQDTYLAELHRAEAAVAVAEATLAQARVNLENLAKENRRIQNLYREGVATEQQRDEVLTRYRAARCGEQLAQAQLAQARAALEVARINLRRTTITAPIAGVVSEKRVEQGDMATPQGALFKLVRTDYLEAHFTVSERYLGFLREGDTRVEILVDALPGKRFDAVVSKVHPTVDPKSRAVLVEARLPNPEGLLRPGLTCRACVVLREVPQALVVPAEAVRAATTNPFVFRLRGDVVEKAAVEVGLREGSLLEVRSGLSEGDQVVVSGQEGLRSGSRVRVVHREVQQ